MRYLSAAVAIPIAALVFAQAAHANIGGSVPGPDVCNYPLVGTEGMEGFVIAGVFDQACSGPTEINGSHWQSFYGGLASITSVSAGIGIAMLTIGITAESPTGVLRGIQYWACPDMTVAAEPNPIMTWNGSASQTSPVRRSACKTIHPKPSFLDAPPPDDPPAPNPFVPPPNPDPFMPAPPPGIGEVVPVNPPPTPVQVAPLPNNSSDVAKIP